MTKESRTLVTKYPDVYNRVKNLAGTGYRDIWDEKEREIAGLHYDESTIELKIEPLVLTLIGEPKKIKPVQGSTAYSRERYRAEYGNKDRKQTVPRSYTQLDCSQTIRF